MKKSEKKIKKHKHSFNLGGFRDNERWATLFLYCKCGAIERAKERSDFRGVDIKISEVKDEN